MQPLLNGFPSGYISLSEFGCTSFLFPDFVCLLDSKMPRSPGSVAAHHTYNMTTEVICKKVYLCHLVKVMQKQDRIFYGLAPSYFILKKVEVNNRNKDL